MRVIRRHWTSSTIPDIKEWTDEMIKNTSYENILDGLNGKQEMRKTWEKMYRKDKRLGGVFILVATLCYCERLKSIIGGCCNFLI